MTETRSSDLKEKFSIRKSHVQGPDFAELELAKREIEQDKLELYLQPLPESAKVLLKFAKERGLIKNNASIGCQSHEV
jgi:hypothetical protein